jgi:alpha-galactosidase
MRILDMQKDFRKYAGPDHWNDPDMMEVGNGLTVSESRAHFSLWGMLAAPLIAGNDIRKMSREIRDILTNKEVIAIDQDRLGVQGFRYFDFGDVEVWAKPLVKDRWAFCFLNRADTSRPVEVNWKGHPIWDGVSGKMRSFIRKPILCMISGRR